MGVGEGDGVGGEWTAPLGEYSANSLIHLGGGSSSLTKAYCGTTSSDLSNQGLCCRVRFLAHTKKKNRVLDAAVIICVEL